MSPLASTKVMMIFSGVAITIAAGSASFALSEATGTTHVLAQAAQSYALNAAICQRGATGSSGADGVNGESGTAGAKGETGTCGPTGATGANGLDAQWSEVSQDIVPTEDNKFTIGTLAKRWKSLQLGPGTLFIQDQVTGAQAGLTVNAGSLLLDGADSLRIGNIQLTATGIKTLTPDTDITIGDATLLGEPVRIGMIKLARTLEFPDGTTQSTAMLNGLTGPQGAQGPQGPQGATGATGPQGATGATGPQGAAGVAVNMKGSFPTMVAFTTAALVGNPGDAWIIVADGSLMVWNTLTTTWDDAGDLQGPQGLQGPKGDTGAQGIQGPKGDTGATGAQGPAGTIAPYGKQYVCVKTVGSVKSMYWGTCASQGLTGNTNEYWILATFPY